MLTRGSFVAAGVNLGELLRAFRSNSPQFRSNQVRRSGHSWQAGHQ